MYHICVLKLFSLMSFCSSAVIKKIQEEPRVCLIICLIIFRCGVYVIYIYICFFVHYVHVCSAEVMRTEERTRECDRAMSSIDR